MIFLEKKNEKISLGIDLGTTYSLVAAVQNERVVLLSDDRNRVLLPSVAHYNKNIVSIGWDALKYLNKDPQNTICSVKRLLGRSIEFIQKEYPILPYLIEKDSTGGILFHTCSGPVTPIDVSHDILTFLKKRANDFFKKEIDASIITVPAYFNNLQREATKTAASLAKINLLRLLNEPTAAAIAYGLQTQKRGIVLVYDLGGGTFDASVLKLNKGIFEVLATSGDSSLGGDDFDFALANYIYKKSKLKNRCNELFQSLLIKIAKETKLKLTQHNKVLIQFFDWKGFITRDEFNSVIMHLINKTIIICSNLLAEINLSIKDIKEVIMVGGSTRVPLVYEKVSLFFSRQLLSSIDPDKVVAIGAAMQADMLMQHSNNAKHKTLLLDVLPLSLGIEVMGGFVEKIILKNTSLPISKTKEFTTYKDNQTSILIHVLQGERERVKDCISLTRFVLRDIAPQKAGLIRISVKFSVNTDGLIDVKVLEKNSNKEKNITIDNSMILKTVNMPETIQNSLKHLKEDYCFRVKEEHKMHAKHILDILKDALKSDGELITETELKKIEYQKEKLEKSIQKDDFFSIKVNLKQLEDASKNFFSLRMKKYFSCFD
ncbi:Fe-S protein assembly chaperone HscA [Buchnera aphidicola (Hyadaphis tataricae)]|uniref:Chaperone protein HscA n=1 Tax=Buchnera aphidicola (Hyadaphis tataricae) TaxID=1241859 RepID=A0A4D6XZT3_9GAMM|nr:Fe-S protein assembly chaperone HscA [Buchnera aphidicola]QCI21867.1 Fe-S protein assembly chaperone HscA [Buchnera aphidicola (Hyadaphis tataricae)]